MRNEAEEQHPKESEDSSWIGLQIAPGESLAATAAQNGVIGTGTFRALEKQLVTKGLKCKRVSGKASAVGIGGKAEIIGKVIVPTGMAGINGVIEWTVVNTPGVPPLTPVNLLHAVGAVVNLPAVSYTHLTLPTKA